MLRTHTCGELRMEHVGQHVALSGWVQKSRDKGGLIWIDLRDRYGITQVTLIDSASETALLDVARSLGREFVIRVEGEVIEREAKNPKMPTGDVEIRPTTIKVLNASQVPPFTIEDETDGGEEIRMQYRYLDIRRNPLRSNLELRHRMAMEVRKYLDSQHFIEVETPVLIKSTPEGARDFVVPSRMNAGQFYALPQSPQTFKQLLMVAGLDRYYQIVKCFRDEDLRADRQPEFTQVDCEMAFVEQKDVLETFEGLAKHLFKTIKGIDITEFPWMTFDEAMRLYGNDKPDTRFEMKFVEMTTIAQGKGFPVFDGAELVVGICANRAAEYSRKQLDELTDFVCRPQIGAKGLVYSKYNSDGTFKSSVDKFYDQKQQKAWAEAVGAVPGDLMLLLAGETKHTRRAMSELRLEMGNRLGLRKADEYSCLWVVDFPLVEQDEETGRWHAMHHPFTSPKLEDMPFMETDPGRIRANAYDLVINGVEIGGGSIRIHDKGLQQKMFKLLGFTHEQAAAQFGFLMNAFQYGAPPHGGAAFGFDRWVALFAGKYDIRDFIAFPKNNAGRDVMIDAPSVLDSEQLAELNLAVTAKAESKKG